MIREYTLMIMEVNWIEPYRILFEFELRKSLKRTQWYRPTTANAFKLLVNKSPATSSDQLFITCFWTQVQFPLEMYPHLWV